ncbi:toll-like receptor 4 [Physella acuta]|uniref:toll-like receptor 4 n=1 Tax=Physella acuta TaxID=109671 RepID=UPI0027DD201B|nr:toll-like receptor 4 [Physella acuta]
MSSLKSRVISSIVVWLICITPIQTLTLETTENYNEALRQDRKQIMCPTKCYCTEEKTTQQFNVDCSNRQLQNIPDLPPQTTRLDLSLNNINNIQSFFFSNFTQLSYLDISFNKLYHIFNNTFYGLHSLKWLSLMRNNLIYLNSTFELDAFNGLDQLEVLHLECNSPSKDNIVYPDQAISKLKNLREINIDGYPVPLGPGFRNLEKLEAELITNNNVVRSYKNMLVKNIGTIIRRTLYLALPPNLEVFISGSMKVEYFIPAITFLNNTVLRYMDYSNNMARCWGGPMNGLPALQYLDLSENYCTKMSLTFFKYLTNLTTLLLQDNVLGISLAIDISGIAFSTLTRLETLNISGNTITSLSRNVFENNINLKYLNLSRNELTDFDIDLKTFNKIELMKSCVSQEIFIGTLVTFFIVLGIVLLSAMFYYNRWKFAYLYYIGSKKLHIGNISLAYKPVAGVFITYEQEPEYIFLARNVFIPRLIQNHVTYVNGEDDFPAGPQQNNIAGAIVGTRKTLILLSRDIFEDRNRELEMNLAIMHEMNCSDRIIVPVFVGHFQVNTWPIEIVTYIRNQNHRCLLYEDTEEFWEMLINQIRQ